MASTVQAMLAQRIASGTTYTLQQTLGADSSNSPNFGNGATAAYALSKFTAGASFTLTKLRLRMLFVDGAGTPGDITARVWSDTAGVPTALVTNGTSDNTVVGTTVGTSMGWIEFTWATGPALTNTTAYWVGCSLSATSATDYFTARSGGFGTGDFQTSTNPAVTWASVGSRPWYAELYVSP